MKYAKAGRLILIMVGVILVAASVYANRPEAAGDATSPQDVINLDRRISLLEQRLNTIDSNLFRLEQQAQLNSARPSATQRDLELGLLQRQLGALQGQVIEITCGLIRLDERTLSGAARGASPREDKQLADPCRQHPEASLNLHSR